MIFLIIGRSCAGKTFFREYVKNKKDVITFEASDYIKNAKKIYKINSTTELFDKIGKEYAAKEIYEIIEKNDFKNNNIIISGFRTLEEVEYVINIFGKENVKIVVIYAYNLLCYLRNIKRKRDDQRIKFVDFKKMQKEDAKLGFYSILNNFEVTYVKNNLSLNKFKYKIDTYIGKYLN